MHSKPRKPRPKRWSNSKQTGSNAVCHLKLHSFVFTCAHFLTHGPFEAVLDAPEAADPMVPHVPEAGKSPAQAEPFLGSIFVYGSRSKVPRKHGRM